MCQRHGIHACSAQLVAPAGLPPVSEARIAIVANAPRRVDDESNASVPLCHQKLPGARGGEIFSFGMSAILDAAVSRDQPAD